MESWFVVHTQSKKESVAKHQLALQGFDVYLPVFQKERRHARKIEKIIVPLFPRYLFVGLDLEVSPWRNINGTRGVSYLLANDGCPLHVPKHIIENLKLQEDAGGFVSASSMALFTKGDKVRVLQGVLQNQIGIFEALDDNDRVQLLFNILGQERKLSLPVYMVEAA